MLIVVGKSNKNANNDLAYGVAMLFTSLRYELIM